MEGTLQRFLLKPWEGGHKVGGSLSRQGVDGICGRGVDTRLGPAVMPDLNLAS